MSDVRAIDELFGELIELDSPEQRQEFLSRVGRDDRALREQLEKLVAAHERAGSFLRDDVEATVAHSVAEGPGMQIGPYKLLQKIGEGGMGVVYMAEQKKPVKRRVALKIIKPGMDTEQVVARFEAERQALAMMDHPNIAKVLEAGATESGRPYFVMELVKGVPITDYCDQNKLTPRERLALFTDVCQAVQHAHQKGIIHRDLKPSNVLVAKFDDKPAVKVIDFGIAKATNQELTERTMFTQFGQIVGTLEYMSPEQAQLNQLDIDTRSDIYSLGVLLYELLTGETPFDRQRLRSAGFEEVLRIIREEEPPRPSIRLRSSATLAATAGNRRLEPKRLGTLIKGDLDLIAMKAIDKERTRRYKSASDLAEDVQRHLDHKPVAASPPSNAYRLRKFVIRNRTGLAISVAAVALLCVGCAFLVWHNIALRAVVNDYRQEMFERGLLAAMFGDEQTVNEVIEKKDVLAEEQIAILKGLLSVYKGESSDAISRLQHAAEDPATSLCTLALLGKAQLDNGQVDAFRETRSRVLKLRPRTTADFIALGNLQTCYDRKSAKVTLDDVVARSSSPLAIGIRAELLWQISVNDWDLEMADQALQDAKAAVRIQPDLPYLHVVLSYSLMGRMMIEERLGNQRARDEHRQEISDAVARLEPFPDYPLGRHTIATYHDLLGEPAEAHKHWQAQSGNWMKLYFAASLFREGDTEKAMEVLASAGEDELSRGIQAQAGAFLARLKGGPKEQPLIGEFPRNQNVVEQEFLILPESIMLLSGEEDRAITSCEQRFAANKYRNRWEKQMLELVLEREDWNEYLRSDENDGYHKATAMRLRGFVCFSDKNRWRDAQRHFEEAYKEAPFAIESAWSLAFARQLRDHLTETSGTGVRD